METTQDIVAKLWSLYHVLRDDGITYNEYVTELTYLLFPKMLAETDRESRLPAAYRWGELARREGLEQLDYHKRMLLDLGDPKPGFPRSAAHPGTFVDRIVSTTTCEQHQVADCPV